MSSSAPDDRPLTFDLIDPGELVSGEERLQADQRGVADYPFEGHYQAEAALDDRLTGALDGLAHTPPLSRLSSRSRSLRGHRDTAACGRTGPCDRKVGLGARGHMAP